MDLSPKMDWTILNQGQTVLLQLWHLKRLFQGSMTLEQFLTKATLLVDEARYPARHKERMVHDTLIAGISMMLYKVRLSRKVLT